MPRWLAWTLGALFALALVLHAHGRLAVSSAPGTGFSDSDLRALAGVADCLENNRPSLDHRPYFAAQSEGIEPLGALSLALSTALWSDGGALGAASPLGMRIENFLLFLIAAAGAGVFLRRLILPWLGDEHARAAAWVAAVLCVVHPLAYAGLVSLAARGDLLALGLCTWSGAQFLRARQMRAPRASIVAGPAGAAGIGVLLAGFASSLALGFPFMLAAAEFIAGRRYRTLAARARTALVTCAVYGSCALAEPLLRAALNLGVPGTVTPRPAIESVAVALEKFGVLALPINTESLTFAAYLLAAALLVVALEPALSAARSAPRLWSLILAVGALSVLGASFAHSGSRVQPADFTRAEALLPGLFMAACGLAVAATALTGMRRALMPAILATGFAAIAHVHADAWLTSVKSFDNARRDIARALEQDPRPLAILIVDVPARVHGIAPLDRSRNLTHLGLAQFLAKDGAELLRERARESRTELIAAPTRSAFAQFARTQRFEQLRDSGVAVAVEEGGARERVVLRLPASAPTTGTRRWYREGASSALDWDPLTIGFVSARAPRGTDISSAPFLGWSAGNEGAAFSAGEIRGVWIDKAGEPQAHFDVSSVVPWLCASRVRLAWPSFGWSNLSEPDAQEILPGFEPAPQPETAGDDWRLVSISSPEVDAAKAALQRQGARGEWLLLLCDLETLEQERFELTLLSDEPTAARLARGAGLAAKNWSALGHQLAWCVEFTVGGVALARSEGLVLPGGR